MSRQDRRGPCTDGLRLVLRPLAVWALLLAGCSPAGDNGADATPSADVPAEVGADGVVDGSADDGQHDGAMADTSADAPATVDAPGDSAIGPLPPVALLRCETADHGQCLPLADGAEVNDVIWLKVVVAADMGAPEKVTLRIDGKLAGSVTAAPWHFEWDSSFADDGDHKVTAEVALTAGMETVERTIVVNNCDVDHDGHPADWAGCDGDDCDDKNPKVHGGAKDEVGDGVDQNCDLLDGVDDDGDGWASVKSGGLDCDDEGWAIHPCADDLAGDKVDSNCDGKDEGSCDDCDTCTADALKDGACGHVMLPLGATCDDANPCTTDTVCRIVGCGSGTDKDCDDGQPCTADGCDSKTGACTHKDLGDGDACDDGDPCTSDDACSAGSCAGKAVAEGGACDDGDACTTDDVCTGSACAGKALVCAGAEVCHYGACGPIKTTVVPAGTFYMGCNAALDAGCKQTEQPQHAVSLDAYRVDLFEATVADWGLCVKSGKCDVPVGTYAHCNWGSPKLAQHPINCVNWFQAADFCAWAGGRLPTEAEWEKAARGGCELYGDDCAKKTPTWPWGEATPDCTRAVFDDESGIGCGSGGTAPVGSKVAGQSPYGLFDMAGNATEWVGDRFDPWYYNGSPSKNPPGPAIGSQRGRRGGAIDGKAAHLRAARRDGDGPVHAHELAVGFRCAWDVK